MSSEQGTWRQENYRSPGKDEKQGSAYETIAIRYETGQAIAYISLS